MRASQLKILVGCERSGIVRNAFRKLGHNAWSCDLLAAVDSSKFHIKDDVRKHLHSGWDMGLFFPPCEHICVSGARYFQKKGILQEQALDFISRLMVAPIPMICIENPVGVISTRIRKPDQIIQPWWFGHEESKKTCLWLKKLPKLKPTKVMSKRDRNLTPSGQNKLGPSTIRAYLRAKTYTGIAEAMAQQWSWPLATLEESQ